jgi:hypothetical protein
MKSQRQGVMDAIVSLGFEIPASGFKPTKEQKRERAVERAAQRATRTPQEQLKRLDELFGVGKGAKAERARLAKQISN